MVSLFIAFKIEGIKETVQLNLLITGANRGLGYELAVEALERGHSVIAGVRIYH